MPVGYLGALEKFDEVINTAQNPQIAALAEGLKLLAQAVRNDLQKIDREAGSAHNSIRSAQSEIQRVKTRIS